MGEQPSSPWVGLRSYTAEDREYFHGRERDERVVAANLRTRRLTVLYGSAGVGKSSLLLAGVVPGVREKRDVLVFREWQSDSFLDELKTRCAELVRDQGGQLDAAESLDELLAAAGNALGAPVLVVFDQFEEYFTAHASADGGGFEPEFARAVNRHDIEARFLISLREDALSGMDRFQARIPHLLGNLIRVEYLRRQDAERAIRVPLETWNREHGTEVGIEDELVHALLPDVSPYERASLVGTTVSGRASQDAVEAPLLQLVLERLWEVERDAGSTTLRLETYRALGGAEGIVGSHFSAILSALTPAQREVCSRFFDRLVTPSGGKIAYPVADLTKVAGELAPDVPATLATLEDARILREIDAGGQKAVEIYHDVLAPTIVAWQGEIMRELERAEERRRFRRRLAQVAVLAFVVAAGVGYIAHANWREARPWGTLSDLGTGNVFRLRGDQVVVGRSVEGQPADVSFPEREVSRVHLIVYRNGKSIDPRSTNGTTVNGRFLKYGLGWKQLLPGDVLVLGGSAVVRYDRIAYPLWRLRTPSKPNRGPAPGWALLVQGRTVDPIAPNDRYLTVEGDRVVASASPRGALVRIGPAEDGFSLADVRDGRPTNAQCAEPNGESYPRYVLSDGMAVSKTPPNCVLILRGRRVQVVPLAG